MRFQGLPKAILIGCLLVLLLATNSLLVVSSSSVTLPPQRFNLRPTAALAEERHRRLFRKVSILEDPPVEWFHPRVKSVYATLHTRNDTAWYQEFVKHRHLSRYERHLRTESKIKYDNDSGDDTGNLDLQWHGNYSRYRSPLLLADFDNHGKREYSNINTRRQLNDVDSLKGGQFNHYQGIPLSQGYGTHYIHLWVGSPIPQRQSVIVDTGSHFTAFPCTGCQDCGLEHHTDPYFDPSQSQTFHPLECPDECQEQTMCSATDNRCEFTQSYTEGSSWKAYQARDVLYAGGPDVLEAANPLDRQYSLPFMFGCLQRETGLFITQLADGIMGMSAHETTLPKQLYNQGKLEYNMFAMCFRKELGTSKRGVTAGSLTLGGVSSTLDTSPMVYARNTQPYGWFTVHVQNIYIAKNGGTQFLLDHSATNEFLQSIVKVPIDVAQVNSGKGVIVDSGTTDTYLNANVMPAFIKVWKQVTGMEYSHSPVYLTQAQLRRLPTILIQCQAATTAGLAGSTATSTVPLVDAPVVLGQVGRLDWEHRSDVLLAIPAENYMEYSPTLKLYTSRLYFTESRGGVLGANAMLGKNVLFDWQHSRIGFSQSTCEYDLIDPKEEQVNYASETYRQGKCVLGEPLLTTSCMDSIDMSVCEASDTPDNVQILGTEVWTRIVEAPGSDPESCQEVATEFSREQNQQWEEPVVECTLNGLCTEHRPCQVPCLEVVEYLKQQHGPQKTQQFSASKEDCGDSFWSACDFDCEQSRLFSTTSKDGTCVEYSRTTRECHIDACGRTDPCVVPFLVHAILVLETNKIDEWTLGSLEQFQNEFTRVSHLVEFSSIAARRRLFNEGDVDVLVVRPWRDENDLYDNMADEEDTQDIRPPQGIQLILQVSISNPKVHKINTQSKSRRSLEEGSWQTFWRNRFQKAASMWQMFVQLFRGSDTYIEHTMVSSDHHRQLLQEVGVLWQNLTQPFRTPKQTFTCNPSDLYPLAKDAVELANGILEHPEFGNRLVENMPMYRKARVISSWTIGTQVYDDNVNYYGHIAMTPYLFIFRLLYETSIVFFLLSCCSCFAQCCHAYRHFCGALRRRCCGKPARYQAVATDLEENDGDMLSDSSFSPSNNSRGPSPRDLPSEMELTYVGMSSHSRPKNRTCAMKRHFSSSPSKSPKD